MRLWHLSLGVAALAVVLMFWRDPVGRVFVITFATGLGMVGFGLAAVLGLFQTVGALGEARGTPEHAEALAATAAVLALGTAAVSGWLFAGAWLVSVSVE